MHRFIIILATFALITHVDDVLAEQSNCVSCHESQTIKWQSSHHAHAMAEANAANVLADFNNSSISLGQIKVSFHRNEEGYFASLVQGDNKLTYKVVYTFGFNPLQQYLVETKEGRLQVFPFAWDSRATEEGGQRWFHILDENVHPENRIHWTQPLQNWNGMCADCHSSGLERNFDLETNRFASTFTEINVGCASCHLMNEDHGNDSTVATKINTLSPLRTNRVWKFSTDSNFASLEGVHNSLADMNNCFACHSLREPLTDGIQPDTHFLDQFSPIFISPTHYHADGQILEEVYVYGSFMQSKMFAAGVQCSDCHDAHSYELKIDGNGLCLQCHKTEVYQTDKHLRHPLTSEGALCVNCHMTDETYMGVDDRRDHKFVIPRPELSEKYGIPNACMDCHEEQSNQWAANKITEWYKPDYPISTAALNFMELMHHGELPLTQHLTLINASELNEFKRASALAMLPASTNFIDFETARKWVESEENLIRLAAAQIGFIYGQFDREALLTPLLTDTYKAIRVAAVEHLIPSVKSSSDYNSAKDELMEKNNINAWRGEGLLNQSLILQKQGKLEQAIELLIKGIDIDPFFPATYVNLVDIYRQLGKDEQEKEILELGISRIKNTAILEYSYALHLVRARDYSKAELYFKKAHELALDNEQYALAYLLILEALGRHEIAFAWFNQNRNRYRSSRDIYNVIERIRQTQ